MPEPTLTLQDRGLQYAGATRIDGPLVVVERDVKVAADERPLARPVDILHRLLVHVFASLLRTARDARCEPGPGVDACHSSDA